MPAINVSHSLELFVGHFTIAAADQMKGTLDVIAVEHLGKPLVLLSSVVEAHGQRAQHPVFISIELYRKNPFLP